MSFAVVFLLVLLAVLVLAGVFACQQLEVRWRPIILCCAVILTLFFTAAFSFSSFGTLNPAAGLGSYAALQAQLRGQSSARYTPVSGTAWPRAVFLAAQDVTGEEIKEMFIDVFGVGDTWKINDVSSGDEWAYIYKNGLFAGSVRIENRGNYTLILFVSMDNAT